MVTVSTIFEVGSEFNSLYLIVSFVFNKQSGYVEYLCVRTLQSLTRAVWEAAALW